MIVRNPIKAAPILLEGRAPLEQQEGAVEKKEHSKEEWNLNGPP